jgi:heat induced stress protein YflT
VPLTTRDAIPAVPRRTVETEANYRDAERAVDWLSDEGFPVDRVSIVGTGLHSVEQVFGRLTTGRAALMGSIQGAWIGLLLGLLFGVFFTNVGDFFGVLAYGLIAGAFWGALWRAIFQYAQGGRREFASVTETRADRYEVQVEESVAGEAERLLVRMRRSEA